MPATSAEIVGTGDEVLPFKVVLSKDDPMIAEHSAATHGSGRGVVENMLPLFQKHEDD